MALESDEVGPEWDHVAPPPKGGGKRTNEDSLFMRMEPNPEPYRIRVACTPFRFRRHRWVFRGLKQWPISPATDDIEKDLDIAWNEGKFMPVTRFAALVFDRNRNNRLRILEESIDVFGPISNHAHLTKVNAASPTKGSDWIVRVTEEIVNGKKQRKYEVAVDTTKGPTPFTDAEIKLLDSPSMKREEIEAKYFKKSTPEHIKDLWDQLDPSARINEPRQKDGQSRPSGGDQRQAAQQPAQQPAKPTAQVVQKQEQKPASAAPKQEQKPVEVRPEPKLDDNFLKDEGGPEEAGEEDVPARMF